MRIKRSARLHVCKKIFTRKMVIPRTWIRKEVVFYSRIQTTRRMGQSCGANDDNMCRKRTPSFPCYESIVYAKCDEDTHTFEWYNPAQEEDLLQKYQERVERLSQQNPVIKFCTDAGFPTTVEVGLYFMTKDTEKFSQFSGLSWVHFAQRWKIIWPKRLDSREHQDWTRIGSHNQLLAR